VRAGARFRTGAYVREIVVQGDRVRGARVGGSLIEADQVVIAAGSWTSLVGGLGPSASAVRPVRGQILECETRPPIFRSIVFGAGGYVVPRPDGRILCGATTEEASFNKEVTLGGLGRLIHQATRVAPALRHAPIRGHRANFRPATDDELPILGPAGPAGLWVAAGHFRNGILLAPITAQIVAAMLTGEAPPLPLEPLSPARFATGSLTP
jgi:glycine oxidase